MKKILIAALFLISSLTIFAQEFTMATYNLRNDNNSEDKRAGNGWKRRCPHIIDLIKFHGFQLFGTQEGLHHQLEDLQRGLPEFKYIGVGRDDGKQAGEYSAIFYNPKIFTLLDSGSFWLSQTPERPGLGWDAACVRICTWGKFRLNGTNFTFMYYNLHMDHVGTVAQAESAKLIMKKIRENSEHLPAILSGDFNIDQNNDGYKLIANSGLLFDAYQTSKLRYANSSTFNAFSPAGTSKDLRIDHIFLTKDFNVQKYGILTDVYRTEDKDIWGNVKCVARTPSDHFPVMIVVKCK